jgi:hypothetical protein
VRFAITALTLLACLVAGGCSDKGPASTNDGTPAGAESGTVPSGDSMETGAPGTDASSPAPAQTPESLLARGVRNAERARSSFEANNHQKAIKQAQAALRNLEGLSQEEAEKAAFDAGWTLLRAEHRLEKVEDPAARLAELAERHPGRVGLRHYREIALDQAYFGHTDSAIAMLEGSPDAGSDELLVFSAFLQRFAAAVENRKGATTSVDPNYVASMARNRPTDARGLFEYAMRAANVAIHDKAILALEEATWHLDDPPGEEDEKPADPALPFLIAFNKTLEWIAIGDPATGVDCFHGLVKRYPDRTDWILYHQVGTKLGAVGATPEARSVLDEGRKRYPDQAPRFDKAIEALD